MRVARIKYPGDGSAILVVKCLCGALFEVPVDKRKLVECVQCGRVELVHELAELFHVERMLAKIGG